MFRSSPRSRAMYRRQRQFKSWKGHVFYEIKSVCIEMASQVDMGEIVAQEEHVRHLDLAVHSAIGCSWKKYAMDQIPLALSQECREFLLAERRPFSFSMLGKLYEISVDQYKRRLEDFKEDFKEDMYLYFEDLFFERIGSVENSTKKKREIRRYLRLYRNHSTVHFFAVYRRLVRMCTDPPLDCDLTIEMLQTLCVDDNLQRLAFDLVPDEIALEIILCHAKQTGFDFWGLWRRTGPLSGLFNPIVDYMCSDTKNSCARILLKYGFRPSYELLVRAKKFSVVQSRRLGNMTIGTIGGMGQMLMSRNHLRMMLIVDTFTAFADFEGRGDISDRVSTLVHLTRTLPEPYVTPSELFNEMKAVLSPLVHDELQEIRKRYEAADVYKEGYKEYQPRRLSHLVRCLVRNIMADKMRLPEGIDELDVPEDVQKFLALQC